MPRLLRDGTPRKEIFPRVKKCLHFFHLFVTQIGKKFESLRSDQRDDTLVVVSDG